LKNKLMVRTIPLDMKRVNRVRLYRTEHSVVEQSLISAIEADYRESTVAIRGTSLGTNYR
jgi:hypothetical protein